MSDDEEAAMDLVVRLAVVDDTTSLATLNQVVQMLHADAEPEHFKPDTDREEVEAFFDKLLRTQKTLILIAERDGRPIGYAWSELQKRPATSFKNERKRLYIHQLVVTSDARQSGVGRALLDASEAQAKEQGYFESALDTWAFNENAQRFFNASGYNSINIVMSKMLG